MALFYRYVKLKALFEGDRTINQRLNAFRDQSKFTKGKF